MLGDGGAIGLPILSSFRGAQHRMTDIPFRRLHGQTQPTNVVGQGLNVLEFRRARVTFSLSLAGATAARQ